MGRVPAPGTAVCAGLVLGGLGSDTGGSIRGPASYCGISGIKPTFGRVSKEGCAPLGYSLDNVGPLTRTVRDCAIMLEAIAGYDPADPCTVNVPVPSMTAGLDGTLAGVRVGVARDYFFTAPELEAEVKAAVLAAIEAMRDAGATIVDVDLPYTESAAAAQRVTISAEAYAYHERDLRERPELYGMHTRLRLMHGMLYTSADFVQAQRVRSVVRDAWTAAMRAVDVLITPTSTTVAPTFAEFDGTKVDTVAGIHRCLEPRRLPRAQRRLRLLLGRGCRSVCRSSARPSRNRRSSASATPISGSPTGIPACRRSI